MTREQEEVINSLEKLINIRKNKAGQIKYDNCICSTTDLEIVLNMLKEKDAEIEKKDKMIDLMADCIAFGGAIHKGEPNKVKEYFERKAKYECKRQS